MRRNALANVIVSVLAFGPALAGLGCAGSQKVPAAVPCPAGGAGAQPVTPAAAAGPAAESVDFDPALLRSAGVDPAAIRCNRENRYGSSLSDDAAAGAAGLMAELAPSLRDLAPDARAGLEKTVRKTIMWRMVRAVLLEGNNNNVGVIRLRGFSWTDERGERGPVLVFRTGLTPSPAAEGSCFRSLLEAGKVRHVVNLFDGDIPAADLVEGETRAARTVGASYHTPTDDTGSEGYGPWRDQLRKHYDDPAIRAQATQAVARLIREQILAPGGGPHRGNVHVHCGGGMHRTGMIVGVIERCVNGEPMEVVEANYRYHVSWLDPTHPGGAEDGNLRFIREFDCALLGLPAGTPAQ